MSSLVGTRRPCILPRHEGSVTFYLELGFAVLKKYLFAALK